MSNTHTLPRVQMHELGMYLSAIELDYEPINNKERAELVTQHFGVLCLEEDVTYYEDLSHYYAQVISEDFEAEDRRQAYYDVTGLNFIM
jgi:hypothetical protein